MSYYKTAVSFTSKEICSESSMRSEFAYEDYRGNLDAPNCIVAGSVSELCKHPAQSLLIRDFLDAYEYTDATARVTDCASEAV